MMFIDGLSFIKVDPHWSYYILYKIIQIPLTKKITYVVVGYSTTYDFCNIHTNQCRTRISQFFIFPTYQRKGFGNELLDVHKNVIIGDI